MAQDRNLPEGTDKIVPGASQTGGGSSGGGSSGGSGGGGREGTEQVIITETTIVAEVDVPDSGNAGGSTQGGAGSSGTSGGMSGASSGGSSAGSSGTSGSMSGGSSGGMSGGSSGGSSGGGSIKEKVRNSSQKLTGQAADKGRGFVSQGLERSSEALSSVSRMVNETASGLDERLGSEYGDYARRAAESIDSTAQKLRSKDPDELIDDTRDFVRKSPGVALAGAAVVGFALARLVKTSLQSATGQQGGSRPSGSRQGGSEQFGGRPGGGESIGGQRSGGESIGGQRSGGESIGGRSTGGQQTGTRPIGGQPGGGDQGGFGGGGAV